MDKDILQILELRCVKGSGGGPEKTIFLSAQKMDPARFKTHILYIREEDDPQFNMMRRQYFEKKSPSVVYREVFEKHRFDTGLITFIADYCFRNSIDLIHSHEYKTDVLARLVCRRIDVKWLASYHLDFADSFKLKLYRKLDYWALKKADKIIAVSRHLKEILKKRKISEGKIDVLPNGIDPGYFSSGPALPSLRETLKIPQNRKCIGFVGRFTPQKNLEMLITAFQNLIVLGQEVDLLLAGDGPEKEKLEALVERMEMEKFVHFTGFTQDVRPLYKVMDLFALSSNEEGMPNSILEAMAMEVPVVATRTGGIPEMIEPGKEGMLVPKGSADEMVKSMVKLLQDSNLQKDMGKRGRERVLKDFSFDARVKCLEKTYEELCQKNS